MNKSLSVTYYDPEAEPVPEPELIPEPTPEPKRKGRPPGTKNKPKAKPKWDIPWYRIIWTLIWWAAATVSTLSLYRGVQGWLGQSAAYITLSVSIIVANLLLYRFGKKLQEPLK